MPKLAYTNKAYAPLLAELRRRIPQLAPHWTDLRPGDPGMVLLELFAGIADQLAHFQDTQAAEAYLSTVSKRDHLINLLKLISYRLDTAVAATTQLRFSVVTPLDHDLLIPKGTVCRARFTTEPVEVPFTTLVDGLLLQGQSYVEIPAHQGIRYEEDGLSSDQSAFQKIPLFARDIAQGSVQVEINGMPWLEVAHFQESDPTSLHFLLQTDGEDQTTLHFGDQIRGAIPSTGPIAVSYLRTLGGDGNIALRTINEMVTPVYQNGEQKRLNVTNPIPATGGADRESLDHARHQAPAEIRSLWKAVTREDYLALAMGFPGVAKAQLIDVNDCGALHYYQVNLVIAPDGGGPPSPALLDALADFLEARKVITVEIRLFQPTYRPLPVDAEIFSLHSWELATVRRQVETALADFFHFERVFFGQSVHTSDLIALIDNLPGVSHVHLNHPRTDTVSSPGELLILGQTNLTLSSVRS